MHSLNAGHWILAAVLITGYFLPTLCGAIRGKAQGQAGVFLVNLVFGWTLVGWLAAFIWACSGETKADVAKRDRQHRELMKAIKS